MPIFYIVPPRKTQLGEFGISISGILGIKTNLLNNAPITSVGALQLDQDFSPVWTSPHIFNDSVTFNDVVIFNGGQTFSINSLNVSGQALGDLIYFNGTNWTRFPKAATSGSILITNGSSIAWSKAVNVSTTITSSLTIGSLNGVLRASSGLVLGSSSINDLTDVLISSASNNQFLKFNSATSKWINSNIPLPDRSLIIRFLNGATPLVTGADQEIAIVPYEPSDGASILLFTVTRIVLQVENSASVGDSIVRIQKVNSNTAFPDPSDPSAVFLTELTLPAGDTEVFINRTDPLFDVYISSGQKLRLVIDSIGTGAEKWTVQLEATAGSLYTQPSGVVPISLGGTGRSTIGSSNTILAVSNSGDKLIYKQLVAGTSVSIVTTPISIGGIEVGGTITISSAGGVGGSGNGSVNPANAGEFSYYSTTGSAVSGISQLTWNNTEKKFLINTLPASWSTTSVLVQMGTSVFNGNTNGTIFGINIPSSSSFLGNFIDFKIDDVTKIAISYNGAISAHSLVLNSNVTSTTATTGALVVTGGVGISGPLNLGAALSVANGGTGFTSAINGEILIGNSSNTFSKTTLTSGNGIIITNGNGSITVSNNSLSELNGLTTTSQSFVVTKDGSDFTISSTSSIHTFSLPDASLTSRGVISTTAQSVLGLKTFSTGVNSQNYLTAQDGYFGGDPTIFTTGGTTAAIYFGIMKNGLLNRFAGMKVFEKQSPVHGAGYLYGDIVFYTDAEAQDFSTERLRIDGKGLITAANDVTINGILTLPNHPLGINYGGTGTSAYSNTNGFIYYNGSNFVSSEAATSGQILLSTSSNTVAKWTSINGDVTLNGQGTTVIGVGKVQSSMFRDSASNSVIGRSSNTSGQPSDIQATTDGSILRLSGTTLGFGSIDLSSTNAVTNVLPLSKGGTGLSTTTPGANYVLGVNSTNDQLEYKNLIEGTNISIVHSVNGITISSVGGSGTSAINAGSPKQLAYYSGVGAVSSAAGIVFSDVPTDSLLALSAQSTTSTALKIVGAAGQNSPMFVVSDSVPNKVFEIGSTGIITVGTWQASRISVNYGGTGTTAFANSNGFVYYNGANLVSVNAATSGQLLLSTSFNTVATWTDVTGDVTLNGQGTTVIGVAKVQNSMLRNSSSNSVIGRSVNSSGAPADIQASNDGNVLRLSGTNLGFGALNLDSSNAVTGILSTNNGGTGTSTFANTNGFVYYSGTNLVSSGPATSGQLLLSTSFNTVATWTDVTGDVSLNGQGTTVIGTAKVQNSMLRNSISNSIIGRSINSSGVPSDIQATIDGSVLRLSGTTLGFGNINLASTNAVSGILPVGNGGTGTSLFAITNGFVYYSGTNLVSSGAATSGQILLSTSFNTVATWTDVNGDVTLNGQGTTVIGTAKVQNSMLRNSISNSIIGRSTNSSGVPSDIQAINDGSVLRLSGNTLNFGALNLASNNAVTGILPVSNGGTGTSLFANTNGFVYYSGTNLVSSGPATSGQLLLSTSFNTVATWTDINGDVTLNGQGTTVIGTAKVQNSMLRNSISNSIIGRSVNSSGVPSDIQAINDGSVLRLSGTTLGFGNINLASVNAVSGILPVANGGTGTSIFANSNGFIYYDGAQVLTSANVSYSTSNINLLPFSATTGGTYELRFNELNANGSNYVALKAPDNIATNYAITVPNASPGANQYLKSSDINGNTQWSNINYSKSISILSPLDTDKVTLFHTDTSIIITKVASVVRGNIPSSSWQLYHGTSRSNGTAVFSSTQTTTSTSMGSILAAFASSIVFENSFLWLELSTQSNVDEVHFTVSYN